MNFDNVAFVGTYECNTNCNYCYAEKYINPYKGVELSIDKFKYLSLKLKSNGVKHVIFIGGEPSLWRHLNDAILFSKDIGLIPIVMSNGIVRIKELPSRFYIHINVLLFTKNKNILNNISYYSKFVDVFLVYNISDISKYDLETIKRFLSSFNLPISLGFEFSHNINRGMGQYFYNLIKYLIEDKKIIVEPIGAIPKCMFTDEEFLYLKSIGLKTVCNTPEFTYSDSFITINPDGESIQACSTLPYKGDINYLLNNDISGYINHFTPFTSNLRDLKLDICNGCEYWGNSCQGGRLVRKYELLNKK